MELPSWDGTIFLRHVDATVPAMFLDQIGGRSKMCGDRGIGRHIGRDRRGKRENPGFSGKDYIALSLSSLVS